MSQLMIDIVTPRGVVYQGNIKACTAPGEHGQFQILNQHAFMLAQITIGEIKLGLDQGVKKLATSGGYLEVKDNQISLIVETAEFAHDIDIDRANESKKRAEKRLKQEEGIDIQRARLALARALNRLKISTRV